MFDDDTFTDFKPRAEEIARGMGKLGVTWSCNAKANVPYATLKIMKDNGLRLLLVGYESGDDQILAEHQEGLAHGHRAALQRTTAASSASRIHGTFILGLPGETPETIQKTIEYAKRDQSADDPGGRSPRRIPARRCIARRSRTAGSRRTRSSISSARKVCNWLRSAIRICRATRCITSSKTPTSASISARRRSGKSCAKC